MRRRLVVVLLAVSFVAACGDAAPVADEADATTTTAGSGVVAARREMSDAEWDRIDDDGAGGVLDCPKYGESVWDYGPIGPNEARGRSADDALLDAIRELGLPDRGWVDLTRDDKHYFVHDNTSWRNLVVVSGDRALGVWRHLSALRCDATS
jgi:hypothetical protein